MRFHAKGALFCLLLCLAATTVASEQKQRASSSGAHPVTGKAPDRQQKAIQSRPLTLEQGLAILGAALDSRHHAGFPSDCSHLVHALYARAGFPYEYASSSDLYVGIDEFRRVVSPQPGDLAVWHGHAGIVINPAQHSFFSVLSSGPGVDSYDSPYWKQRGRPRFFRYVKKGVSRAVLSTSARTASLKPTVLGNTQPYEPPAEDPTSDGSASSSETGTSAKLSENQPASTKIPRVAVINSVRPKAGQVSAAFLQACKDSEEGLRGRDLFKPAQSLVVFDRFDIRKMHIAGNQGWVEVQIEELGSLTGSKVEVRKRSERQRWPLSRRDDKSWELTLSRDTIYLPQHIAERILAHQLAQLTEDSPDTASRTQDKAELAQLLNVLLRK
ncbi:MAG: C40 family peptidase [Acidobacteriia bacterium]|nr:C40 family peptidase [Terriglobia bacterium]